MFRRTLIVLEPRSASDAVVGRGAAMAQACGGEIVFYTGLTRERPPAADLPDRELAARWDSLDDMRLEAERLHRQARQVADDRGVLSRSVIANSMDPVRDILNAGQSHHCDAIMLASDGSNAVVRLVNGSSVPGLITASPIPVMVCPAVSTHTTAESAATGRLLVNVEESDATLVARRVAVDLARELAAEVLFVHITPSDLVPVVDPAGFVGGLNDGLSAEIQAQSRRLLASATSFATKAGLAATALSLPAGTTGKDIAHVAAEQACDLIVVAHRGSNAVIRLLTGNLIPGLITAAEVPVLICREDEHSPTRRTPRRRQHRHRAAAAAAAARAAQARDH